MAVKRRKRRVVRKVEKPVVPAVESVEGDVIKTQKMDGIEVQDALVK